MDADTKVPSPETPKLELFSVKPGVGQNPALYALPTAGGQIFPSVNEMPSIVERQGSFVRREECTVLYLSTG